MRESYLITLAILVVGASIAMRAVASPRTQTPAAARAIAFLSVEVPAWQEENGCFSCHNNGDAVRALIAASRHNVNVRAPLETTLSFLSRPETWADNSRGGEFDDQALASIQFAGALVDAIAAGLAPADALPAAARLVASNQQDDGSWQLDDSNSLGSPATYGTALATWSARRTLLASGLPELQPAAARADAWIRGTSPQVLPDLAATLLMLADAADEAGMALRRTAVATVLTNQHRSGGWGPYPTVRPEPFDTAIAVLALDSQPATPEITQAIERGLAWLGESALPDGSWLETTRPAGQRSYAQLISTTGWATTALLTVGER